MVVWLSKEKTIKPMVYASEEEAILLALFKILSDSIFWNLIDFLKVISHL